MKKLPVLFCLLVSFAQNASAIDINKYLSATWWNQSQSGHGFNVQIFSKEQTLVFWYVYHPDGTPLFLIAVGNNSGNVTEGSVFYNSGMRFGEFDPADIQEQPWGTFRLTFHTCGAATFEYTSTMEHDGVPFGSGSIPLTRFLGIDEMQCSDNPHAGLYRGNFYSNLSDEIVDGVAILEPGGEFAAVSFDGIAGFGTWWESGGAFDGSGIAISMDPNDHFVANLTLSGVIAPEHRVFTSYTISGGDSGIADLYATPSLYRRGATLAGIAGDYIGQNLVSREQGMASISGDGSISGSDNTTTCTYDGQLQVTDERFNLLRLSVTVTNCDSADGFYEGFGIVDDYQDLNDGRSLLLLGTNGTYATVIELFR